ncbi:MAG: hypothetical protein C5B52_12550 [Bacteroidetes bacterium]|nr:MAG: hypothetical protein C5B52_12550 [Bacteroidota bacterium]
MYEIITRFFSNLLERTEGPMHFRFLLQPLMSLIFATLAAIRDAKKGVSPYLMRIIQNKNAEDRKKILREGWKDISKVFVLALILDVVYQLIVTHKYNTEARFYPLESIFVAIVLAIVPYILIRGPLNRLISKFVSKKEP